MTLPQARPVGGQRVTIAPRKNESMVESEVSLWRRGERAISWRRTTRRSASGPAGAAGLEAQDLIRADAQDAGEVREQGPEEPERTAGDYGVAMVRAAGGRGVVPHAGSRRTTVSGSGRGRPQARDSKGGR
jgi:hypothetical protein